MSKADVITKLANGNLGIVALSAWLLNESLITNTHFTVIGTAYIVCEAIIDAVCKCRRQPDPQNGERP